MGFLSDAWDKIKKVKSKLWKPIKKVRDKIKDLSGKVMSAIGLDKVMNKLGPLGTLAVAFMAPWAAQAMMSSSVGWVQAAGNMLNAVTTTVQAPFKAVGEAVGAGVNAAGGATSEALASAGFDSAAAGVQTVTDKIAGALSANGGGDIKQGMKNITEGVGDSWKRAFTSPSKLAVQDAAKVSMSAMDNKVADILKNPDLNTPSLNPLKADRGFMADPDTSLSFFDKPQPLDPNAAVLTEPNTTLDNFTYDGTLTPDTMADAISKQPGMSLGPEAPVSFVDQAKKAGKAISAMDLTPPKMEFPELGLRRGGSQAGSGLTASLLDPFGYGKDFAGSARTGALSVARLRGIRSIG